jgi:hypothetical protein
MALIEQFFHPTMVLIAAGGGRAGENPEAAAFRGDARIMLLSPGEERELLTTGLYRPVSLYKEEPMGAVAYATFNTRCGSVGR